MPTSRITISKTEGDSIEIQKPGTFKELMEAGQMYLDVKGPCQVRRLPKNSIVTSLDLVFNEDHLVFVNC